MPISLYGNAVKSALTVRSLPSALPLTTVNRISNGMNEWPIGNTDALCLLIPSKILTSCKCVKVDTIKYFLNIES